MTKTINVTLGELSTMLDKAMSEKVLIARDLLEDLYAELYDWRISFPDLDVPVTDKMLEAGRAALAAPQQGGWIPVSERLPEPETDMLVYGYKYSSMYHTVAGLFDDEWLSQETEYTIGFEVTHWQPLPPPPKESK